MFSWTTTTILNSLTDTITGKDLIKVWTKAEDSDSLKAGFSGTYPVIKIKRDHTFETRYITKAYKAIAFDPSLCEMQVNCGTLLNLIKAMHSESSWVSHARLSFYIALEGSEESLYANDGYQKGKPFSIGFDVTSASKADDIANLLKKNAEKFGVVVYGRQVFEFTVSGTTLIIKGTHEYQRFKNAFVAVDDVIDEIVVDEYTELNGTSDNSTSDRSVFTLVKRGANGFGTYNHLIKDLRLPTCANTRWNALHADERPVIGAKYNQYIITYCAPSMVNPGLSMVGQHGNSVTTHVFWVNTAIAEDFEKALEDNITFTAVNTVTGGVSTTTVDGVKTSGGESYSESHEQSEAVSHKKTTTGN